MDRSCSSGSELAKLAFLLRLAAMTGREIAAVRSSDKDEILDLIDRAEEVGRRLDEIANREAGDSRPPNATSDLPTGREH